MRADAVRHRQKLIEAGSRVFARGGADVPLETVLKEAGVGRGTLYRHFPNREKLLIAVLENDLQAAADFVAADEASPSFLRDFLRMQALTANLYGPPLKGIEADDDAVRALQNRVRDLYEAATTCAHRNRHMSLSMTATDLMRAVRMVAAGATPLSFETEDSLETALDMMIVGIAWSSSDSLRLFKSKGEP